jgi:hypothetical protein
MFDIANYYSMKPVLLDEHFRSLPPIINFSNKEFYGNRIRVMKQDNPNEKVLEIVHVPDGKVDFDATRNLPEIEAVVKRVHEMIVDNEKDDPDNPITIGIISPFRAQVEQLKISIGKVDEDENNIYYMHEYYNQVLSKLDANKVLEELAELGDNIVLLCFENEQEFCHRHLVAAWLERKLQIIVPEVSNDRDGNVKVLQRNQIYIDEFYKVTLAKTFTDIKAPDSIASVIYEVE